MSTYHIVCRDCIAEGVIESHRAKGVVEELAELHRETNPEHTVVFEQVEGPTDV